MKNTALAALCGAALAAACAPVGGPGVSAYYDCGNGTRLKVDALSDSLIQVKMNDDAPITLPEVRTASGAKYMTARHSFWSKGDQADWTVGRMAPMTCQKVAVPRGI